MAGRSSTSSSDRLPNQDEAPLVAARSAAGRRRFPYAFVLAVVLLLIFEIVLRRTGWPKKWPYDIGRMEYFVANAQIERSGAPEISVVGSSRTRESLVLPLLAKRATEYAGHPVSVGSFAVSGAYASDFEAIGRRLVRAKPKPKVILIGTSERDLIATGATWDEVVTFHKFEDLPEVYHERGASALFQELPVVLRGTIGRFWRTLGLREMIRFKIGALATGNFEKDPQSPAEGGLTQWQRLTPTRTLAKNPIKKSRIVERSANFRFSDFPDPALADALDDLLTACDEAGVPVVMYEVQQSRVLRNALPPGFYKRYTDFILEMARKHDDQWIRLDDLGLKIDDRDMREPSHMSKRGAERLTAALVSKVVGPMLSPEGLAKAKVRARRAATRPASEPTTAAATTAP